jgi:hypothetical protein
MEQKHFTGNRGINIRPNITWNEGVWINMEEEIQIKGG